MPGIGTGGAPTTTLAPNLAEPSWTQFAHAVAQHAQQAPRPLRTIQFELDPPELGPLIVRFQDHGDRITAHVVAQHDHTRWLVESHAAQIRDVLAQSGVNLETHTWTHSDSPGGNPMNEFGGRPTPSRPHSKGTLRLAEAQMSGPAVSVHAVNFLV
jgi:flagellar hook-length control protein FliK